MGTTGGGRPAGRGQEWSPLEHGGPHHGPLSQRERGAYRFTLGLTLWVQALFVITMWALRFVYAGAQSPMGPVFRTGRRRDDRGRGHRRPPAYQALAAARVDDQRLAARRALTLALLRLGLLVLGGIAFDWSWLGLSGSSRLGEIWYGVTAIFAVQLFATLVTLAGAVATARRGRASELTFDGLRMQWMYLTVAFALTYLWTMLSELIAAILPPGPGLPVPWWCSGGRLPGSRS